MEKSNWLTPFNFCWGVAEGMQDKDISPFGGSTSKLSMKNAMLNGLSLSALDQAKRFTTLIEKNKGYIVVEKGYPIIVFLTQEQKIPEAIWE